MYAYTLGRTNSQRMSFLNISTCKYCFVPKSQIFHMKILSMNVFSRTKVFYFHRSMYMYTPVRRHMAEIMIINIYYTSVLELSFRGLEIFRITNTIKTHKLITTVGRKLPL